MNCGCKHVLDLELLWLWHRPAAAAPIRPPPWELPYAVGVVLKRPPPKKKVLSLFLLPDEIYHFVLSYDNLVNNAFQSEYLFLKGMNLSKYSFYARFQD